MAEATAGGNFMQGIKLPKLIIPIFISLFIATAIGCSVIDIENSETELTFTLPGNQRSATSSDAAHYDVYLYTSTDGQSTDSLLESAEGQEPGSTISFAGLDSGYYTLEIIAFDSNNKKFAFGTCTDYVHENQENYFYVKMTILDENDENTEEESKEKEETQEDVTQEGESQEESTQEEVIQEEENQEQTTQEDVTQGDESQEDVTQGESTQEDVTQEGESQEESSQEEVTQEEENQEQTTQEDVTQGESTQDDESQEDVTQEEETQEVEQDSEDTSFTYTSDFLSTKFYYAKDVGWDTTSNPSWVKVSGYPYRSDGKQTSEELWTDGSYVLFTKNEAVSYAGIYLGNKDTSKEINTYTLVLYTVASDGSTTETVIGSDIIIIGIGEYGMICQTAGKYGIFIFTQKGWAASSDGTKKITVTYDKLYPTMDEILEYLSE